MGFSRSSSPCLTLFFFFFFFKIKIKKGAEESDAVEAKKHIIRMQQSGASCSQPSARLVYVRHSVSLTYYYKVRLLHAPNKQTNRQSIDR